MKGPFKVKVSKEAIKLNLSGLSNDERRILVEKCNFDPEKHEIYKFFIIPIFPLIMDEKIPRKIKKIAYEKVNRVLIHVSSNSDRIKFYSVFPTTCTIEGQWSIDYSVEGSVNLLKTNNSKLAISGIYKNKIRKDIFSVYSGFCLDFSQWIFLDKWIKKVSDYNLEITAIVSSELGEREKYVKCDGQFQCDNRILASFANRKIFFEK